MKGSATDCLYACAPAGAEMKNLSYPSPHELLVERHLGLRGGHLREEGREGLDQVKKAYCFLTLAQAELSDGRSTSMVIACRFGATHIRS
jgi:hypothetical protein